ncbi:hypothetical protein D186_23366 [Citrobacter freundii ATCC 8090 = MTCC 1658 = NBRC 12681]|uniref:hypothetical protein n=1 Tax=Citrobacter freundii TaxID=546 RepID=UPI000299BCB7|nr:hypothetical protein [Citrobacter freundii]EKS54343.1 hypothetical protein D186_23366 [Citrobacter freundii ATCC 8090 = MTCC 1658 = NBRC 12681]
MLEQYVHAVVDKKIRQEYPHIELPGAVCARITKAQLGEAYHTYSVKILDANREVDERFPEVPNVKSKDKFDQGDTVAVLLLYGQLDVFIVGEVV